MNDTALRDGNGAPTMLYEDNGEVRRVSTLTPLPIVDAGGTGGVFQTVTLETYGTGIQTLLTPQPGKRIIVRGAAMATEPATGGESTIRFNGGTLVHKIYRGDQSGALIPLNLKGSIDEILVVETSGFSAGQQAFFALNYQEE